MKKVIYTDNAPKPLGPYSQAIESGGFVFLAGQIPIDPKTNEVITGDTGEQMVRVMENIKAVLQAAGLGFKNAVKTTIFLTDLADFNNVNEVYGRYIGDQPPARTTIQVAALPKGVNVEVEILAARG
jgi:2-iminobutanoate/2-iminopropanoate deaminase